MNKYHLPQSELKFLKEEHRHISEKRFADQVKAVYLLGSGWKPKNVAEAMLLDDDTIRGYYKRYIEHGIDALTISRSGGSEAWLSSEQMQQLDKELNEILYSTAKEVAQYVKTTFSIEYTERGITNVLHRLNYVYKKPEIVPGKADAVAQEAFLEELEILKSTKGNKDPLYYMDATHPHHNVEAGYGWIKKGETYAIPSNTGRQRLNINGVISVETFKSIVRYDDTINAQSTLALFQQIESQHPDAGDIYIICDNAGYYRSKLVQEYLKDSLITLVFLPPYSPNLNLIERYWKFFKSKVIYGIYYETFAEFKMACDHFFENTESFKDDLCTLLNEKFQIIRW